MPIVKVTVPLSRIAHGRSGDKGNHSNIAVIAYTEMGYLWLRQFLTEELVGTYFQSLGATQVERYLAPNLRAMNFVLRNALAGGASESLRIDTQGKTFAMTLLQMPIELPSEALATLSPFEGTTPAPEPVKEEESHDLVRIRFDGPFAIVKLNRPEKRNALSRPMIQALRETFQKLRETSGIRCIILSGNGPVFCAGMDLDELRNSLTAETETIRQDALNLAHLYDEIKTHPLPTICVINGSAIAGGAGLVSVCDLAISVPEAKFGYPEVRRGLVAAMVAPHLLRHIGERMARYLLLTGELIDAHEALACGLINRIVPTELLLETAMQWAELIRQGGLLALGKTKQLLDQLNPSELELEALAQKSAEPRFTAECVEGLKAFFDKTSAPWTK